MREKMCNLLKIFLPCMFITYMAAISFFTHTHIINGVTIVHSHPFKSDAQHEHSTTEIELIAQLNQVSLTDQLPAYDFEAAILPCLGEIFTPCDNTGILLFRGCGFSLRAPPVA